MKKTLSSLLRAWFQLSFATALIASAAVFADQTNTSTIDKRASKQSLSRLAARSREAGVRRRPAGGARAAGNRSQSQNMGGCFGRRWCGCGTIRRLVHRWQPLLSRTI